jgi:hypothetical protein
MDIIQKGDLIHIPQGVFLIDQGSALGHYKTDRPRTAIFLGECRHWGPNGKPNGALVFLDGKEFNVRLDHIYLLKEKENKLNVS